MTTELDFPYKTILDTPYETLDHALGDVLWRHVPSAPRHDFDSTTAVFVLHDSEPDAQGFNLDTSKLGEFVIHKLSSERTEIRIRIHTPDEEVFWVPEDIEQWQTDYKQIVQGIVDELERLGFWKEISDNEIVNREATSGLRVLASESAIGSGDIGAGSSTDSPTHERDLDQGDLPNITVMKNYYKDYSPSTAREILNHLPEAYKTHLHDGGRWGPGIIAKLVFLDSATVGRYLKAFRMAGLTEWKGAPLPK